ncbi:hypothetical protein FRC03_001190 [Tulasnella sp. 419]|nr:hypothetical protein FRC03_001190 [Tulasnella sp. 419]
MSFPENKWAIFLRGEVDSKLKRFEQANHAVVRELPPLTRCIINPIDNRLGGSPMFLPHQKEGSTPTQLLFEITPDVITAIHDPVLDQYEPKAHNSKILAAQVTAIVRYIFYDQCGVPLSREPNWEDLYKAGFRVINYPAQLPFPWDVRMFEGSPFSTEEAMVFIIKQFAHEDPLRRLGVVNRYHDARPQPFISKVRDTTGVPFAWSTMFHNRPLPTSVRCHDNTLCTLCVDSTSPKRRGLRYVHLRTPQAPQSSIYGNHQENFAGAPTNGVHTQSHSSRHSSNVAVLGDNNSLLQGREAEVSQRRAMPTIRPQDDDRSEFIKVFKAKRRARREEDIVLDGGADFMAQKRDYQLKIKQAEEQTRRLVAEYEQKIQEVEAAYTEQLRQTAVKRKRLEEEDEEEAIKQYELHKRRKTATRLREQLEEEEIRIMELQVELGINDKLTVKTEQGPLEVITKYPD